MLGMSLKRLCTHLGHVNSTMNEVDCRVQHFVTIIRGISGSNFLFNIKFFFLIKMAFQVVIFFLILNFYYFFKLERAQKLLTATPSRFLPVTTFANQTRVVENILYFRNLRNNLVKLLLKITPQNLYNCSICFCAFFVEM